MVLVGHLLSGISSDIGERERVYTASGASSKTGTVQYKPVTRLAGNNALADYEQSRGYDQISHALSNIHGLYGWSCNFLDVISVYSLNPGKLPGRFSYERPGYEAKTVQTYRLFPHTRQMPHASL